MWINKDKLFLSSWPNGKLRPVRTLGKHPSIRDGIYIEYLDGKGGTDTTTNEFLFDYPELPERIKESDVMSDNKLYEWFEQVQSLYEERYKMMLDNSDISDWSDYFHDGYTPQEAISDENLSGDY